MRIVIVDTGRGRTPETVAGWREQLGLVEGDELAAVSWQHPRVALPLVEHLVFGPTLDWSRPEPVHPNITRPRLSRGVLRSPLAALPRTHPRRVLAAVGRRTGRLTRPVTRRVFARTGHPLDVVSSSAPLGQALRRRLAVKSDGVATDFSIAVARSQEAAALTTWADVLVPVDLRSRKAAWVLARRVAGPAVPSDVTAAARVVRELRDAPAVTRD
ncbi:hypothetical protein [Mobilicoccus pelagius]|uniref:Uncharacterized protein n=1 Tax=Mobilicoccus pelagius NBRC 104925 TaxID=1089455 RepID=H5UMW8_9MICO|nr:hypothetical protein [Mobilicoccus pelagius]GAB47076.1 hypothetical protein MOPEL_003_01000 [Mobilicoccus pelagius NBRC 104925]